MESDELPKRLTSEDLDRWNRKKLALAGESGRWGEVQVCSLGVDLRAVTKDGMWVLTLTWDEVAELAQQRGQKWSLKDVRRAVENARLTK